MQIKILAFYESNRYIRRVSRSNKLILDKVGPARNAFSDWTLLRQGKRALYWPRRIALYIDSIDLGLGAMVFFGVTEFVFNPLSLFHPLEEEIAAA